MSALDQLITGLIISFITIALCLIIPKLGDTMLKAYLESEFVWLGVLFPRRWFDKFIMPKEMYDRIHKTP